MNFVEDIQCEVKKKLNIFHDRPPITFSYVNSYAGLDQHPFHVHQNIELYFCISEHVDYVVNNSYYTLQPGDIVIIDPGEVHKVTLRKPHQYERFFIILPPSSFSQHTTDPLAPLLRLTRGTSARLRLPPEIRESVRSLLYETLEICREDTAESSPLIQTKVYANTLQILCTVSENAAFIQTPESQTVETELATPLADVMIYIDRHLKTITSVKEIADAIHVSPSYLSALFRKHMGVPLVYYLQSLKMSIAKQMLEEGYTVADACRETGYTDCSYFIRIFKRHLGATPLRYRNAFRAAEGAGGEVKPTVPSKQE
ncbi:MAG: helix-turn-helix domain-containing protein [Clostridia bacterium]|nr:helix-turn-helix domain-containing protein [Clostridia bacterium]